MKRAERGLWPEIALGTCLAAWLALMTYLNIRGMAAYTNGDIYADMELARQIWLKGSLFPDNWIYGNQYSVIATPAVAALFYGLSGSMNLSMALATALMGLLILVSLRWMLRPFVGTGRDRLAALLLFTAAPMADDLLLQPIGQLFFTLASYYACYLITLCAVFGDYVRAVRLPERGLRPGALLLSLLLSFLSGMQSLRQMTVMALPILALELLRLLLRRSTRGSLLRAALYAVSNAAGYALMKLLKIPTYTIYGQLELSHGGLGGKLRRAWESFSGVSGLQSVVRGPNRLFFLLWFLFTLGLVLAALILLWKKRRELDGLGLLWLLCLISLGGVLLAGLLLDIELRDIYLFVWYLLVALSLPLVLAALRGRGARPLLLALCVLSLGNLAFSLGSSLRHVRSYDASSAEAFCRDAEAAGIELVYGDWKTVPPLIYSSDGRLTAGFWNNDLPCEIREYINRQDLYAPEDNARALYVFSSSGLDGFQNRCRALGESYTLFGVYGDVKVYSASAQMMYHLGRD